MGCPPLILSEIGVEGNGLPGLSFESLQSFGSLAFGVDSRAVTDAPLLDLSVVVPVYNSAEILPDLVARLSPVLDAAAPLWEIVLVNDGSRDGSWGVIAELAREHPRVRGIDLMRNYGQHNALLCGIRAAPVRRHRHAGRRPAEPAGGDPQAAGGARTEASTSSTARRSGSSTASSATSRRGSPRSCSRERSERAPRRRRTSAPSASSAPSCGEAFAAYESPYRVDRRAADLGDQPLRRGAGRPRTTPGGAVQLHAPEV